MTRKSKKRKTMQRRHHGRQQAERMTIALREAEAAARAMKKGKAQVRVEMAKRGYDYYERDEVELDTGKVINKVIEYRRNGKFVRDLDRPTRRRGGLS